jgi:hypothetical protein
MFSQRKFTLDGFWTVYPARKTHPALLIARWNAIWPGGGDGIKATPQRCFCVQLRSDVTVTTGDTETWCPAYEKLWRLPEAADLRQMPVFNVEIQLQIQTPRCNRLLPHYMSNLEEYILGVSRPIYIRRLWVSPLGAQLILPNQTWQEHTRTHGSVLLIAKIET